MSTGDEYPEGAWDDSWSEYFEVLDWDPLDHPEQLKKYAGYLVKTFAEALRGERQSAGLTQSELAERAGLESSTISKYESGKKPGTPRVSIIVALEAALGIEDRRLHSAAGWGPYPPERPIPRPEGAQVTPESLPDDRAELLKLIRIASEKLASLPAVRRERGSG